MYLTISITFNLNKKTTNIVIPCKTVTVHNSALKSILTDNFKIRIFYNQSDKMNENKAKCVKSVYSYPCCGCPRKRPEVHGILSIQTSGWAGWSKPPTAAKCDSACAAGIIRLKRLTFGKWILWRGRGRVLQCKVGTRIQNNKIMIIYHDETTWFH